MDINELKTGDWVMFNLVPVKIIEVHNTLGELTVTDTSTVFNTSVSEVSSIPFTKDFFEKNGWRKKNEYWVYGNLIYGMTSYGNQTYKIITLWNCEKEQNVWVVDIGGADIHEVMFVHELQHILWAFRLNDDLKV